jgi:hypothetical protein
MANAETRDGYFKGFTRGVESEDVRAAGNKTNYGDSSNIIIHPDGIRDQQLTNHIFMILCEGPNGK